MSAAQDDWAADLASKLADLDVVFTLLEDVRIGRSALSSDEEEALGARHDGADIPHQYARVVSRVIEALERLPQFWDGRGLSTLSALRLDLIALDEGNRAQRLSPPSRGARPGTPAGRRMYQSQVILCVRLLEELGLSGSMARAEVAATFSRCGHRGQQGDDLSPETLTRWREAVMSPERGYEPGRRMIDRKIREWRESPLWPPSLDEARAFVELRATNPVISLAASK